MAISRPMFQPFSPSRFASSLSSSAFGSFSSSFSLPRLITVHLRVRAHTCWLLLNRPLQISHPWSSDGKRHEVDAFEFSTQKICQSQSYASAVIPSSSLSLIDTILWPNRRMLFILGGYKKPPRYNTLRMIK